MPDKPLKYIIIGLLLLAVIVLLIIISAPYIENWQRDKAFVTREGPELRLDGEEFRIAGSNNYYLMYKSQFMVDDVLETAAANGFTVLRTWGFLDIGAEDGDDEAIHGKADGVYFQYWDGVAPAYNDGPDGLEKLDYVIYKAGQEGIKLVIPLTNNWNAFGGMAQYVQWRDGKYHDEFYSDPMIVGWYKDWIAHLLNRTNTYTGVAYKDDPTIMIWELANEPRCRGSGDYPSSGKCDAEMVVAWADEISSFIKEIDSKHLVAVGDEGFYCLPESRDMTEECAMGGDTIAFTSLPNIDVMSFHLYPDHWIRTVEWGTEWIEQHILDARALGKPAILGEYGLRDPHSRSAVYEAWNAAVLQEGGSGSLFWILSGLKDDGELYADYDGFRIYCPSDDCSTLSEIAAKMKGE